MNLIQNLVYKFIDSPIHVPRNTYTHYKDVKEGFFTTSG